MNVSKEDRNVTYTYQGTNFNVDAGSVSFDNDDIIRTGSNVTVKYVHVPVPIPDSNNVVVLKVPVGKTLTNGSVTTSEELAVKTDAIALIKKVAAGTDGKTSADITAQVLKNAGLSDVRTALVNDYGTAIAAISGAAEVADIQQKIADVNTAADIKNAADAAATKTIIDGLSSTLSNKADYDAMTAGQKTSVATIVNTGKAAVTDSNYKTTIETAVTTQKTAQTTLTTEVASAESGKITNKISGTTDAVDLSSLSNSVTATIAIGTDTDSLLTASGNNKLTVASLSGKGDKTATFTVTYALTNAESVSVTYVLTVKNDESAFTIEAQS